MKCADKLMQKNIGNNPSFNWYPRWRRIPEEVVKNFFVESQPIQQIPKLEPPDLWK